jgi:hypothetical protein
MKVGPHPDTFLRLREPLFCQLDGLWCARLKHGALG